MFNLFKKLKTMIKFALLLSGVFLLAEAQAQSYDIIKRFQILEDKFRTYEMLDSYRHEFIFDVTALANTDVTSFIDEAQEVADFQGTDNAKLGKAQEFLRKYNKTEQNLRVGVAFGIPIFSFTAFGIKIKPSVRVKANLGFLMGIQTTTITPEQAVEYLGSDVPQNLKTAFLSCSTGISAGADIVQYLIDTSNCGLTALEKVGAQAYVNQYFYPSDLSVPDIYNYVKGEGRVGLNFDYVYNKHFFGNFSLYALGRADYRLRVSADTLIKDGDVVDLGDDLNTTVNMAADYTLGYKNGNLVGMVGVEDVKIANVSNNDDTTGALLYGNDPLIRLHSEYIYKFSAFSIKPFVGTHKRSRYSFADGLYAGADLGAHVWDERIGLRVRSMIDNEHFTFSPQAKLWLFHVDYMLKQPISSEVDGLKPATIHSVNIRFSI